MALLNDLNVQVADIFKQQWETQTTNSVPDPEDLLLGNHAKLLEATVLYADLDGSTNMVDKFKWHFSAEVYKAYLRCAARIVTNFNGVITAYDGDRIMAIFTGDRKNTNAVKTALAINRAVVEIIRPALKNQYPATDFELNHKVGVDTSELRAARIGVRGNNDLVWVGRAANYAAKLNSLDGDPIWITKAVYDAMNDEVKFHAGKAMWAERTWTGKGNMPIYCSNYLWRFA